MHRLIETALKAMPLIFAFGFLVPVFNQALITLGWQPPFGLSPLALSLIIAGFWGVIAQATGRWI
jgi:hypothetical protein